MEGDARSAERGEPVSEFAFVDSTGGAWWVVLA